MASTRYRWRKAAVRAATADDFDDLHGAFFARLQGERVHLVTLSAALARAEENPQWIFDDLVFRARRLCASAAILEVRDIAAAARALEQAAVCASMWHADHSAESVWSTLIELVSLLGIRRGPTNTGSVLATVVEPGRRHGTSLGLQTND